MTNPVTSALAGTIGGLGQINQIAAAALALLGWYRKARDEWKAAHPDEPADQNVLTDDMLFAAQKGSAQDLITEAQRLQAKYATPDAG